MRSRQLGSIRFVCKRIILNPTELPSDCYLARSSRRAMRSAHYDDFAVPYEDGMSVLDALRWIRIHLDSTLAIRYSCINANACKLYGAGQRRGGVHLHRQIDAGCDDSRAATQRPRFAIGDGHLRGREVLTVQMETV